MLAHSQDARDAIHARELTPGYRRALRNAFGASWLDVHRRVKHWVGVLR